MKQYEQPTIQWIFVEHKDILALSDGAGDPWGDDIFNTISL